MIKAVLLDLGETLLTYGKVDVLSVFNQACRQSYDYLKGAGQPVGSFRSYTMRNLFSIRFRCLVSFITGNDFDSLDLMKKLGQKHGFNLTEAQWEHVSWIWYDAIGKLAKVEPDISDTLEKLRAMNLKIGILSNTFVHSSTLINHLKQLNLWHFFDEAVFSYEFRFRKPSKKIFLATAEKIGIEPQNILFVGDRVWADIKGSMNAGMTAVLKNAYTNYGKRTPKGSYKIENLSELPALIEKINK